MAPMNVGGNNDSDGCLSERGINYFVERAKGGTGLIVTGAIRTNREFERNPKTIPQWMLTADYILHSKWISELSERCHDYGTKVAIQLTAGGQNCRPIFAKKWIRDRPFCKSMFSSASYRNTSSDEGRDKENY